MKAADLSRALRRAALPVIAVAAWGWPASAQCPPPNSPIQVTVQISESHAIDDAEGLFAGDPELYVIVNLVSNSGVPASCTVGPRGSSRTLSGPIGCTVTVLPPYPPIRGSIALWDQDGDLGGDDTLLDLTPVEGKTLDFTYDPLCDRVRDADDAGDVPGCGAAATAATCSGAVLRSVSGTDDPRGRVTFRVVSNANVVDPAGDLRIENFELIQVTPDATALADNKPAMIRFDLRSTYNVQQAGVEVSATATDEMGNVFTHTRAIDVPPCQTIPVNLFAAGWDGPGSPAGFRPQAGPNSPPLALTASATVDPGHVVEPCPLPPTLCDTQCYVLNNTAAIAGIPVKPVIRPTVAFQPFLASTGTADDDGDANDAEATRVAATPYLTDIYPTDLFTTFTLAEPMTFDTTLGAPHLTIAMMDLPALLAGGFDRLVGVVKSGFFQDHFAEWWERSIGASAGEFAPRVVILESPAAAVSAELVAHELGHTWGLTEAPCPIAWPMSIWQCEDEYNFCPSNSTGQCPAVGQDGLTSQGFWISQWLDRDGSWCVMGRSAPDPPTRWIDSGDYNHLIQRFRTEDDPDLLWMRLRLARGRDGSFHREDVSRLTGAPDILSENGGGPANPTEHTTSVVFRDAAGVMLDRVNFTPESVDTDGDERVDAFGIPEEELPRDEVDMAVALALPAATRSLDLVRREFVPGVGVQETTTDTLVVPQAQVAIVLDQPISSVRVHPNDLIPIRWHDAGAGFGLSPAASRLSYVFVSPDNGAHWIPIAARLAGSEYLWRARTDGRYLVRVFATGGFNVSDVRGESDVDGDGCGDSRDPNPTSPNPDDDGDGIATVCDNCPTRPNAVQQDADRDGVGDGCDNCPEVANATQTDLDGDTHGDACDCAPTVAGAWAIPAEVQGLTAGKGSGGPAVVVLSWSSLSSQSGPSVRYDGLTGTLGGLRSTGGFGGATCLGNDTTSTSMVTTQAWPPGSGSLGYWYLARGQNACGRGTYGDGSRTPDPRDPLDGSASPCP